MLGLMCLVVDHQLSNKGFMGFLLLMQFLDRGLHPRRRWLVNPQIFPSGFQIDEQKQFNRLRGRELLNGGF